MNSALAFIDVAEAAGAGFSPILVLSIEQQIDANRTPKLMRWGRVLLSIEASARCLAYLITLESVAADGRRWRVGFDIRERMATA